VVSHAPRWCKTHHGMPKSWVVMMVLLGACLLASMAIAIVKLA
jgi:hypothetical protein